MSERRLIGIDLAWSKCNCSGCAELVWDGEELELRRLELLCSVNDVISWIDPALGDWVVAVDAPLVVSNREGSRAADRQVSSSYGRYAAGAHSANLNLLGDDHQGGRLVGRLQVCGGTLAEQVGDLNSGPLVFETYPHPAMVELFGLTERIKYKKGNLEKKNKGQQQLADEIGKHLCDNPKGPRLCRNELLDKLLRAPETELEGQQLKEREDLLDAVVCAYVAAWVAKGLPWHALGKEKEGVIVVPDAGRLS